jgi:hypothetical protein
MSPRAPRQTERNVDNLKPVPKGSAKGSLDRLATGSLEGKIQSQVARALKKAYPKAWIRKMAISHYGRAGVGDLMVCVLGRLANIEIKTPEAFTRPGHNLSSTQGYVGRYIIAAGGLWTVVTSVDEALTAVAQMLEGDAWVERSVEILRECERHVRVDVRAGKRKQRRAYAKRLAARKYEEEKDPEFFAALRDITATSPETKRTLET